MKRIIGQLSIGLMTLVGIERVSRRIGVFTDGTRISRGVLLKAIGVAATALVVDPWREKAMARVTSSRSVLDASTCVLTPEQTEGPYYIAREKVRSNLREHKPGTAFKLQLKVVDAATCKPIKNAAVDIWHCDAGGVYSGFEAASAGGPPGGGSGPTDKATFLRGIQFTDAKGLVTFESVYPGWYRGRTVHVHIKVHVGGVSVGHVVHTGQLFFQDSLTSKVFQTGVYKARAAARDTFNSTDSVFSSGGPQSMLAMKHDGHGGYVGTKTLGVHRT